MRIVLIFVVLSFFSACASSTKNLHKIVKTQNEVMSVRQPSSKNGSESAGAVANFKNMKPLDIIEYLRNECCENRVVAPFDVKSLWTDDDMESLKDYLHDSSEASSVSRPTSSVHCQGEKYQSTTEREAHHLLEGYKRGVYPVSQCSTYDFRYVKIPIE